MHNHGLNIGVKVFVRKSCHLIACGISSYSQHLFDLVQFSYVRSHTAVASRDRYGEPLQSYEVAPGKIDASGSRTSEEVSAAGSFRGKSL